MLATMKNKKIGFKQIKDLCKHDKDLRHVDVYKIDGTSRKHMIRVIFPGYILV